MAGARLRAALHDLAVFADATLANAHDAQDKGKLRIHKLRNNTI